MRKFTSQDVRRLPYGSRKIDPFAGKWPTRMQLEVWDGPKALWIYTGKPDRIEWAKFKRWLVQPGVEGWAIEFDRAQRLANLHLAGGILFEDWEGKRTNTWAVYHPWSLEGRGFEWLNVPWVRTRIPTDKRSFCCFINPATLTVPTWKHDYAVHILPEAFSGISRP